MSSDQPSANPSQPLISAVINYYNPGRVSRIEALVTLCMEALKEFTFNSLEVICSDGSGFESNNIKAVCERLGFIYTVSPIPQNYAAVYNHGLAMARGQYLAVVENDVFVHHEWDKRMLAEMKRTGASMAVPYLSNCDVIVQQLGFVVRRRTFEPTMISQNLMLFDREAYAIAFPMDVQFNGMFNDFDIYLQLKAAGKRMIVVNAGYIVHYRKSSLIFQPWTHSKDLEKFKVKHPELKYWDKHLEFSYGDKIFTTSRMYRWMLKFAGLFPRAIANFTIYHLRRFEPIFQGI